MLRGIFIYVASTLPSRRRGFRHASSQPIKKRSRRSSTRPECPAGVGFGATRLCILDRIAYPAEIYSHAKIFLTNVQTPLPRLKPGAKGRPPLTRLGYVTVLTKPGT